MYLDLCLNINMSSTDTFVLTAIQNTQQNSVGIKQNFLILYLIRTLTTRVSMFKFSVLKFTDGNQDSLYLLTLH
jgi:hypothetical protein